MSTPCCQISTPHRLVVSEYEVPKVLVSQKWGVYSETLCICCQAVGSDPGNVNVTWRRYVDHMEGSEVNDEINVKNWSKDKHVQDVVTFLRREAAMADEQLIYEVSKPDVPGTQDQ